jgi:DNA-binding IscR family transcriptional regulator
MAIRIVHSSFRGYEITVLDVVLAIEGNQTSFRCTEIRQNGPLPASPKACRRACGVARAMYAAEDAWRASLAGVTIADLASGVEADAGPQTWPLVQGWLAGA